MKILVATRRSQGDLEGDYMACVPGELVWIPDVCDRDLNDPEHGCGCSRGFGGLASHRATTTAEVVESPVTEVEVRLAFETSLRDQGWIPVEAAPELVEEVLQDTLGMMRAAAEAVPLGAVVRREFDSLYASLQVGSGG